MPIEYIHDFERRFLTLTLTGKLDETDYEQFGPMIEGLIAKHDAINLVVVLRDFHGWTAGALWEDVKFDARHFNDINRLAIVGETKWQKGMAFFCKPFTTADVRFFERGRLREAEDWAATHQPATAAAH